MTDAPVYALHASASTGRQWQQLAADMSAHHVVRMPDLPGYGTAKDVASGGTHGLAAIAGPIIAKIEDEGRPVHLVGHSFGATVALKIASMRPDLVISLTLYEPVAFRLMAESDQEGDRALYREIQAVASRLTAGIACGAPEVGMQSFVDYWNGAGTWSACEPSRKRRLTEDAVTVARDFAAGDAEATLTDDIATLDVPTMLMMGMDSPTLTQRIAEIVAGRMPNATLAMLPESGHMAPLTDPDWINQRIASHIGLAERGFGGQARQGLQMPAAA